MVCGKLLLLVVMVVVELGEHDAGDERLRRERYVGR
jgi:hypothetical protein